MSGPVDVLSAKSGTRTWDDGARCDECCNGDRCDDPTHLSRENCPHCLGTGYALWTARGVHAFLTARATRREYAVAELAAAAREKQRVTGGGNVVTTAESLAVHRRLDAALARIGGAA